GSVWRSEQRAGDVGKATARRAQLHHCRPDCTRKGRCAAWTGHPPTGELIVANAQYWRRQIQMMYRLARDAERRRRIPPRLLPLRLRFPSALVSAGAVQGTRGGALMKVSLSQT